MTTIMEWDYNDHYSLHFDSIKNEYVLVISDQDGNVLNEYTFVGTKPNKALISGILALYDSNKYYEDMLRSRYEKSLTPVQ